jgi:glycosyltransferase involved in cell wall biosynthesis
MRPAVDGARPVAAVAWDHHQGRTQALATALGGCAWYIRSRPTGKPLLPLRYLIDGIRMWRLLLRHRPRVLLVIAPPLGPPLVGLIWCLTHRCLLVVDCHTGVFHSWKWRWSLQLIKLACRSAVAALVHTREDEDVVRAWGATALLLPDDIPDAGLASPQPQFNRPCIVVAGSLDGKEPVAATLEAAALVPEVSFRLTGDPQRVSAALRRGAPDNVVFTGWLDYPRFLGELLAADAIAVFSTDPHIMNRAAFEAVGLGRPLVLTDFPGLRARFGEAALFSPNDPQLMATTLRRAVQQQDELAVKSGMLQTRLRAQHLEAVARLKAMLDAPPPSANDPRRRRAEALES